MKARHEFKHSLNYSDYLILRSRLGTALTHDAHTDANGEYKIRSLYFDTPDDTVLREKIDGVDRREKFRIRYYGRDLNYIMLEKKCKVNGLCYKQSETVTADEIRRLEKGDLSWMIQEERPLVLELYGKMKSLMLRPQTVVDYIREPFVFPAGNVRVTLDRDIRTGLFSKDFLSDNVPMIKAGDEIVLMEVKYDEFLPEIITKLIQVPNRRAGAYSKYAACRIYG